MRLCNRLTFAMGTVLLLATACVPFGDDDELSISLSGRELLTPPLTMEGGVYNFDENSGIPTSRTGEAGNDLWFVVKTEPDQDLDLDPVNARFTIDVPPGHYVIQVLGRWPDHPPDPSS